jgi:hypothetical protein
VDDTRKDIDRMNIILYLITAIVGYAIVFCLVVGSVVGFFQILKWLFK